MKRLINSLFCITILSVLAVSNMHAMQHGKAPASPAQIARDLTGNDTTKLQRFNALEQQYPQLRQGIMRLWIAGHERIARRLCTGACFNDANARITQNIITFADGDVQRIQQLLDVAARNPNALQDSTLSPQKIDALLQAQPQVHQTTPPAGPSMQQRSCSAPQVSLQPGDIVSMVFNVANSGAAPVTGAFNSTTRQYNDFVDAGARVLLAMRDALNQGSELSRPARKVLDGRLNDLNKSYDTDSDSEADGTATPVTSDDEA